MKAFAPLSRTLPYWPADLFGEAGGMLDLIGVTDFDIDSSASALAFSGKVAWLQEISVSIPALNGASFALLDAGGFTEVGFRVEVAPQFALTFGELTAQFRFVSEALRPVTWSASANAWVPVLDPITNTPAPAVFEIGDIYLHVDGDGQVAFVDSQNQPSFPSITPPALEIAGSGMVLELMAVQLFLSDKQTPPEGAPVGFKGVAIDNATLHLGDAFGSAAAPDTIAIDKLLIGSSGFSGTVSANWNHTINADGTYSGSGMGHLGGLTLGLTSLEFVFSQNRLVGSSVKGIITLPFFDHPLNVDIGYTATGGITIGIDSPTGLFTLAKPGFLSVEVESLEIDINDGKGLVKISGSMTPLVGGLNWPSFELRELSIDSDGHVKLEGGWIDLPKQVALNFHAFNIQITKFGMGKLDAGGRWVGFSGQVNLIKGLKGDAAVDGLRILLRENGSIGVTLDGVRVEMELANVFKLKGGVKFTDDTIDKRFDGAGMIALKTPAITIDSQFTIGRRNNTTTGEKFPFFAIYAGVELPTGIPLGPSGVGLYGFAGLLAIGMKPGRLPEQPWYAIAPDAGWYNTAPVGAAELVKWAPRQQGKAFGLGLTLGTYADNGFTFNARALLVIAFPGPIIMIEGRGNLLKQRQELSGNGEPLFRAIAVIDEEAGEYTFGLDAFYQYDRASGDVVSISGSVEAYYKKSDPRAWHIYLGKRDPVASRIRAKIISLFEANTYFMIDAKSLQMGAWIGYDKEWHPGPLKISLEAWLEANAILSFKPNHFHTDLWLHAAIELSAFGFGVGLAADALLAADIMDPFHLLGELHVELQLPWPLKDISKDLTLEWGPRGNPPPIPIVLQSVAIEHLKSTAVWSLATNDTLLPNYDDGNGYLIDALPSGHLVSPPTNAPIVPMDCRPTIAFGRAVHDDAFIGVNALPRIPAYDQIGNPALGEGPAQVRYALTGVVLEKWKAVTGAWAPVAGKGSGANAIAQLFGSWAPVPSGTSPTAVDQTKLMLWSKTGFDHTRMTGRDWNDWFAGAYDNYPCVEAPPMNCFDFERYTIGPVGPNATGPAGSMHFHPDNSGLGFSAAGGFKVVQHSQPVNGKLQALTPAWRFGARTVFMVSLSGLTNPTRLVRFIFDGTGEKTLLVVMRDAHGNFSSQNLSYDTDHVVVITTEMIIAVQIQASENTGLVEVCLGSGTDIDAAQALSMNIQTATSVWSAQGDVLEPHTDYRLVISTQADVIGEGAGIRTQASFAYFKTGGPPSLGGFTVPDGQTPASIEAGPDNLVNYVSQTVPATIGDADAPAMPRPVFRAYDVGVVFNADYVDLLYKMSFRDLRLQIFDSNGKPAYDRKNRALSFENPWGVTGDLVLDDASANWLSIIDSDCMPVSQADIVHNQTLTTIHTPILLGANTRYSAGLTPLILHDDFHTNYENLTTATGNGAHIRDWIVAELGAVSQDSTWTILADSLAGNAGGPSTPLVSSTGNALGSAFVWHPSSGLVALKSFRMSVFARASAPEAIGAVFLYQDAHNFFQFSMRQLDGMCHLISWTNGIPLKLSESIRPFALFNDVALEIDVIENSIRIFMDEFPVLSVNIDLKDHTGGTLGLWGAGPDQATFKDLRVESFSRQNAPAYKFDFVTSDYVNFFHLAHARRTPVWDIETSNTERARSASEITQMTTLFAVQTNAALDAPESRQYEDLASLWLGPGLVLDAKTPEVHRILRSGETMAWLIRTPEPWDWKRCDIQLRHRIDSVPASECLGPVKITGASLGQSSADDEFVDILVLEKASLRNWKLEMRTFSSPDAALPDVPFDDMDSTWIPLYQFNEADGISEGMRIRLYSGAMEHPTTDHTHINLNMISQGEPDFDRFAPTGVDLRLVDVSGRIASALRVLPEASFSVFSAPDQVRFLRKDDATGLILIPGVSGSFPPGAFALSMTYRRDNTSHDPKSIVLSQAGNSSDELAFLPLY